MDDMISRQAAIDALEKIFPVDQLKNEYTQGITVGAALATEYIKQLPSAQPKQRWIPCSERLPEEPNVYTVTDGNGNVVRFVFYNNETSREYWRRCVKA